MKLILKLTLKNIISKPFRTIMVVFAIFICSLSALFCFDLGKSIDILMTNAFGGDLAVDLVIMSSPDLNELPDDFPEYEELSLYGNSDSFFEDIDGEYNYVSEKQVNILGMDIEKAVSLNFIDDMKIGDNEAYMALPVHRDLGFEVGDTITVHDRKGDPIDIKIIGMIPPKTSNSFISTGNKLIVNLSTSDLISCGERDKSITLVDIKDNSRAEEAQKTLEKTFPNSNIISLIMTDEDLEYVNEIKALLYLLFVVTFFLVIFVTASISERIVNDRMSFIGTLRSLGMSSGKTGRILLFENTLYALIGSVPAIIGYMIFRSTILTMILMGSDDYPFALPPLSIFIILAILSGAIAIECAIPMKAILKALKTSIRDIIFDNKDTAYKFNIVGTIIGLILLIAGIVTFFFRKRLSIAIVCLSVTVVALALLFPWILKGVSFVISKIAEKLQMQRLYLASVEAVSRKSTVGSGVLCATAAAMCVIIFTIAMSVISGVFKDPFDCDVIFTPTVVAKKLAFIDDLEGVNETEYIYETASADVKIDDESLYVNIYGLPDGGYKYYGMSNDLLDKVENGTVIVDKEYAKGKNYKVGDTIHISFSPFSFMPIEKDFKIAGFFEIYSYEEGIRNFVISMDDYIEIYHDSPNAVLIKCDDAEGTAETLRTYAVNMYNMCKSKEDLLNTVKKDMRTMVIVISIVIGVALTITCLGMISNLLIGFEGRKKECAVLLSTAMKRSTLSGILYLEVLIASITAAGIGTLVGTWVTYVLKAPLENSKTLFIYIEIHPLYNFLFFIVLTLVFTTTVLFPIRSLRKMKLSEQLKYE